MDTFRNKSCSVLGLESVGFPAETVNLAKWYPELGLGFSVKLRVCMGVGFDMISHLAVQWRNLMNRETSRPHTVNYGPFI